MLVFYKQKKSSIILSTKKKNLMSSFLTLFKSSSRKCKTNNEAVQTRKHKSYVSKFIQSSCKITRKKIKQENINTIAYLSKTFPNTTSMVHFIMMRTAIIKTDTRTTNANFILFITSLK